jgi:hypothetical protein
MKGCARSCLLLLLGWGAAAYAFYYYFVGLRDFGSPMYWGSAVAGLCVVAAVGYAIGIGTTYRERTMLLEAVTGMPPEDGKWVAVSGTIHSLDPLTAPISGEDAVAYEYKIYRHERSGKNSSDVTYFDGKALASSTISTRQGTVRLLAVPAFTDIKAESIPPAEAIENARAYVAQTTFEMRSTPKEQRAGHEENDDDGQYRKDKQYFTRDLDLGDNFQFQEKRIRNGEQVCAFGMFSRQRGGLIPHPNWARQARLMRGDAQNVADQLRKRMIWYVVGIGVAGAIAYGIVKLYHYKVATLG